MTDSRLSSLAMLSIEASCVRSLDLDDVIKAFACQKTCSKLFCYCYDVTSDCRQLWRLVVKLAGRAAKFNIWLNIRDCRPSCFYNQWRSQSLQQQARRQDLAAGGPKTRKRGQKPEGGATFLKYSVGMYAATGGSNVKWRGTDLKWGGQAPLTPRATVLCSSPNLIKLVIFSCPCSYIENIHFSLMKPNPNPKA